MPLEPLEPLDQEPVLVKVRRLVAESLKVGRLTVDRFFLLICQKKTHRKGRIPAKRKILQWQRAFSSCPLLQRGIGCSIKSSSSIGSCSLPVCPSVSSLFPNRVDLDVNSFPNNQPLPWNSSKHSKQNSTSTAMSGVKNCGFTRNLGLVGPIEVLTHLLTKHFRKESLPSPKK